uniref:Uncharacterized protein n=1 Tax=Rhizophora mucronata TaxID=61149 RepID=A0A2P2PNQ2_RHIMU
MIVISTNAIGIFNIRNHVLDFRKREIYMDAMNFTPANPYIALS